MLLENKKNFSIYIFLFLIFFSSALFSQSELINFFSSIAGERNFVADLSLYFHVYNKEKQKISDFEMSVFFVVRNMEDFYIKVEKPDVIGGITFVYYSNSNRMYSGYGDKFYMDSVEVPESIIVKTTKQVLDVLSSPFFVYKRKKDENGAIFYTFALSSALFLRKLGIEPISISVKFIENKPKEIIINGEKDEYVKLILNRFEPQSNVNKYFAISGY